MRSCNTRFVTEMCLWPSHEIVSHLFAILFSPMTNLSHSFNSFFVVCNIYGVKMKTCVNIKVIIFWLNIVTEFFVRLSVQTSTKEREFAQQGMSRTVFLACAVMSRELRSSQSWKKRWLSMCEAIKHRRWANYRLNRLCRLYLWDSNARGQWLVGKIDSFRMKIFALGMQKKSKIFALAFGARSLS